MAEETKAMTVIRIINNMMMALGIVLLSQGVYVNITYTTLLVDLTVCLYVVAMHFVLLRLRTFFPFLAAGLGLLTILYLILMPGIKEGNYDYLPVLVVASITFAMTFYAHINESQMIKPSYLLLIYCAFYLLLATYLTSLVPLLFGEVYTICIIELSFVYSVLGRQDRRLRLSSDRTYVPVERIRSSNFLLMSIGSGIIFFFGMIFSVIGHGKKIIEAIWNMILSFLRFLFSGINYETESKLAADGGQGGSPISFGDIVPQEENPFLDKLWEILSYVMSVVAVGTCIFLVVFIVISIYRRFQQTAKVRERDKIEYLKPEEHVSLTSKAISSHIKFADRSPAARIRRRYKKFIQKAPGYKDIEGVMTPKEIESAAYSGEHYKNMEMIHELYEKARYSNRPMKAKDAAEFEKLL